MKVKIEKRIGKENKLKLDRNLNGSSKIRTILSLIALLMGLFLMFYPKLSKLHEDYQQKMLIKRWQESLLMIDNVEQAVSDENRTEKSIINAFSNGNDYSNVGETSKIESSINIEVPSNIDALVEETVNMDSTIDIEGVKENNNNENNINNEYIKKNMVGMLIIDEIDLNLPILKGTTKENLSIALTTIEPTNEPGQVGNLAIAGHRSHAFGRNFNRLDEITAGELIKVDIGKTTYTYEVTEKLIVKPEEIWVLNGDEESKEITLVTCHPLNNPTHRLIIKGKIIE